MEMILPAVKAFMLKALSARKIPNNRTPIQSHLG